MKLKGGGVKYQKKNIARKLSPDEWVGMGCEFPKRVLLTMFC